MADIDWNPKTQVYMTFLSIVIIPTILVGTLEFREILPLPKVTTLARPEVTCTLRVCRPHWTW